MKENVIRKLPKVFAGKNLGMIQKRFYALI